MPELIIAKISQETLAAAVLGGVDHMARAAGCTRADYFILNRSGALRQQINVLRRTAPKRLLIGSMDRLILVGLYRLFPDVRGALTIIKPDTVLRWHRAGFRA